MVPLLRILILDPLAYVAACIASGYTVAYALFGIDHDPDLAGLVVWSGFGLSFYAGLISFVPALAAIVLAEAFGWRSIFYWVAVGGGIGLVASGVVTFAGVPQPEDPSLTLHLAAGFVGGLVYWLIAGRLAGIGWPAALAESGNRES